MMLFKMGVGKKISTRLLLHNLSPICSIAAITLGGDSGRGGGGGGGSERKG